MFLLSPSRHRKSPNGVRKAEGAESSTEGRPTKQRTEEPLSLQLSGNKERTNVQNGDRNAETLFFKVPTEKGGHFPRLRGAACGQAKSVVCAACLANLETASLDLPALWSKRPSGHLAQESPDAQKDPIFLPA